MSLIAENWRIYLPTTTSTRSPLLALALTLALALCAALGLTTRFLLFHTTQLAESRLRHTSRTFDNTLRSSSLFIYLSESERFPTTVGTLKHTAVIAPYHDVKSRDFETSSMIVNITLEGCWKL